MARKPVAVVDIGSNSVRLVVYSGRQRAPSPIFNEKVMAGLGAGLRGNGQMSPESEQKALSALCRYKLLLRHMGVREAKVVATAAVRDAANADDFIASVKAIGLPCEVVSAEDEARFSGLGVLSAFPGASGIVGDLGGGSLELIEIGNDGPRPGLSLPLGVLRVERSKAGEKLVRDILKKEVKKAGLDKSGRGQPFYMVGGSWRALAKIDMIATDFPLPATHHYRIKPERVAELRKIAENPATFEGLLSSARLASAPVAAMVLERVVEELQPSELIVSAFGLREGLLYADLDARARKLDPLIEAARDAGGAEHRFGQHGDLLHDWIAPLFEDGPKMERLRRASCLLADVAWQAAPPFRADRGVEMALHGDWTAVDAAGRVIMAQALTSNFGRDTLPDWRLTQLVKPELLLRAHCWGLAMRLGQRLSGGVASVLERTHLNLSRTSVTLCVPHRNEALAGDAVRRRLQRLAEAFGRKAEVATFV
ncbi:Ppx/GppA family phosphatase [Sphingomonas daechungensis]|uniref:Ppx/GppA phosphatase family protein n=1 Tax=Sphingomonas daechungensis TaxID=1176646 RepID=UPI0037831A4F